MAIDTDHHDEEVATLDEQEYQRRILDATSTYAALEVDAWREACAEQTA